MASPYRSIYLQLYFTQKIHSDKNGNFNFAQPIEGIERKKKEKKACLKKVIISKTLRKCHLAKQLPSPQFTPTKKELLTYIYKTYIYLCFIWKE